MSIAWKARIRTNFIHPVETLKKSPKESVVHVLPEGWGSKHSHIASKNSQLKVYKIFPTKETYLVSLPFIPLQDGIKHSSLHTNIYFKLLFGKGGLLSLEKTCVLYDIL